MTKTKIAAAALAVLTIATASVATSSQALAWKAGPAIGLGIVAGAAIGAAAASNYYYDGPYYRCRYVERVDRWGNIRTIKVCDGY